MFNNPYFDEALGNWSNGKDYNEIELRTDDITAAKEFFYYANDLLKWFLNWIRDTGYQPDFEELRSLDNLFAHIFFISNSLQIKYELIDFYKR